MTINLKIFKRHLMILDDRFIRGLVKREKIIPIPASQKTEIAQEGKTEQIGDQDKTSNNKDAGMLSDQFSDCFHPSPLLLKI